MGGLNPPLASGEAKWSIWSMIYFTKYEIIPVFYEVQDIELRFTAWSLIRAEVGVRWLLGASLVVQNICCGPPYILILGYPCQPNFSSSDPISSITSLLAGTPGTYLMHMGGVPTKNLEQQPTNPAVVFMGLVPSSWSHQAHGLLRDEHCSFIEQGRCYC